MSDSLTTRLLAEIERREGVAGKPSRFGGPLAPEVLAYLAALRGVVGMHTPVLRMVGGGSLPYCPTCGVGPECKTLLVVAEGLGVEA